MKTGIGRTQCGTDGKERDRSRVTAGRAVSSLMNHTSSLSLYFFYISLFTHILQEVFRQPVHLLLWSGFSHLSLPFCLSFSLWPAR